LAAEGLARPTLSTTLAELSAPSAGKPTESAMKAAFIHQTGPAENIQYGELPDPRPAGSQVLIRVGAVAMNPVDTYIRGGMIQAPLPMPFIVGCDLAGTVVEVGPDVKRFRAGDRVWGTNQSFAGRQGTFSELACVDDCWLYPTPAEVRDEDAAAASLVGVTAHLGLFLKAGLRAGETIFVTGGSGGVGSTVVQMAKAVGARAITTAGSDEKARICRELGADAVILYRSQNLDEELKRLAPEGVHVWWEVVRSANFEQAVPHLRPRGRMVVMAGRDARPVFPLGPFYVKDCSLFGFAMFNATPEEMRQCAEDINRWLADGRLKPRIDRVLPLSETAAAHKLQEENTVGGAGTLAGKIVLRP
jgi:NADPH2:quinone reductase